MYKRRAEGAGGGSCCERFSGLRTCVAVVDSFESLHHLSALLIVHLQACATVAAGLLEVTGSKRRGPQTSKNHNSACTVALRGIIVIEICHNITFQLLLDVLLEEGLCAAFSVCLLSAMASSTNSRKKHCVRCRQARNHRVRQKQGLLCVGQTL